MKKLLLILILSTTYLLPLNCQISDSSGIPWNKDRVWLEIDEETKDTIGYCVTPELGVVILKIHAQENELKAKRIISSKRYLNSKLASAAKDNVILAQKVENKALSKEVLDKGLENSKLSTQLREVNTANDNLKKQRNGLGVILLSVISYNVLKITNEK